MRITIRIRQEITQALIAHAFDARKKAMLKRENDLALAIYRMRLPESFEKKLDAINEAAQALNFQRSFFSTIPCIDVERPGVPDHRLHFSHRRPWETTQIPDIAVMDDDAVAKDFDQFVLDDAALEAEIGKAKAEIKATLEPIYTAQKLREAWPEVMTVAEPVLVAAGMQPKAQPLVVATESLNATLGLPADIKEAA